jgi:hypothetical protein
MREDISEIKWYFTEHPDKINEEIKSIGGSSILPISVKMGLPPDLIQFLIDKGARVNNRDLITSLMNNVDESSDFETARILINNGADINYRLLNAVIKGYVAGKDGLYPPDQVGMKMKILDKFFETTALPIGIHKDMQDNQSRSDRTGNPVQKIQTSVLGDAIKRTRQSSSEQTNQCERS